MDTELNTKNSGPITLSEIPQNLPDSSINHNYMNDILIKLAL